MSDKNFILLSLYFILKLILFTDEIQQSSYVQHLPDLMYPEQAVQFVSLVLKWLHQVIKFLDFELVLEQ